MNRAQIVLACGAIALMVGSTAALSNSSQNSGSSSALAIQSNSLLSVPSPIASSPERQISPSPASPVPPPAAAPTPNYYSQQITTCAGADSNANFRAYPSLDPRAVLGVVAFGDSVQLTGRVIQGDRVEWFEAIAPALYPSPDTQAQNKLDAGQTGWIASCFVGG
jgi:hypothetical protein